MSKIRLDDIKTNIPIVVNDCHFGLLWTVVSLAIIPHLLFYILGTSVFLFTNANTDFSDVTISQNKIVWYLRFHYWIITQFNIDSPCSLIQSCLCYLHWHFFVLDGLPQQVNVVLHIKDFLHSLKVSSCIL